MVYFTPWKRHNLYFWCFFKKHDFEMKYIQNASAFDLKVLQRFRFGIEKKYIFKVVLNASCFPFKKTQHVRVSVKNYTTIERPIDVWQLQVVHLVNKSTTNIVVQFSSLKLGVIDVDRKCLPSVTTWKTRWNSHFGEKNFKVSQILNSISLKRQILK